MRKRNWACPECAEECEPEWPKVIDELQAEVQKLKGKVAELRAEVDELKVRVARDEDVLCSMSCAWDAHG